MKLRQMATIIVALVCMLTCWPVTAYAQGSWQELSSSSWASGWPSGGVGTWTLSLGNDYIPVTVGTDSTGVSTWWAVGGSNHKYYFAQLLESSPSWGNICDSSGCTGSEGSLMILTTGPKLSDNEGVWSTPFYDGEFYNVYYEVDATHGGPAPNSYGAYNFASGRVGDEGIYAIGRNGTGTCSNSGYPGGPCISFTSNYGTTWSVLEAGAEQIVTDLVASTPKIYALGSSHWVYHKPLSGGSWASISKSICGGGTLAADEIAANNDTVFAINDNSGSAGTLYYWVLGTSTCWDNTWPAGSPPSLLSISASVSHALPTDSSCTYDLVGTDGSGNLWGFGGWGCAVE